jgi:DNA-binding transcriptional MerR regulator
VAKEQILFEFSDDGEPQKEFLSGQPVHPQPVAPPAKKKRGRKKISDFELEEPIEVPEDEVLFSKSYWTMGEVAEMFKVTMSQIRFWENSFDILEPKKNKKGDRYFRPVDVKNLELIHDLVRRRKFTIEGAKEYLKKNKRAKEKHEMIAALQKIRTFLLELKAHM